MEPVGAEDVGVYASSYVGRGVDILCDNALVGNGEPGNDDAEPPLLCNFACLDSALPPAGMPPACDPLIFDPAVRESVRGGK